MRISEGNPVLDTQLGTTDGVRSEAGVAGAGGTRPPTDDGTVPASGDRVSVSDTARALAELRARVGDPDTIRPERVAMLQSAIDAGRYQADPQEVAKSLLREVGADALV